MLLLQNENNLYDEIRKEVLVVKRIQILLVLIVFFVGYKNTQAKEELILNKEFYFFESKYKKISVYTIPTNFLESFVVIKLEWYQKPKIRSYDVLEFRLFHSHFIGPIYSYVLANNKKIKSSLTKQNNEKTYTFFQLENNFTSYRIQQSFLVQKKGIVVASYQHALDTISFLESQIFKTMKTYSHSYFDHMNEITLHL